MLTVPVVLRRVSASGGHPVTRNRNDETMRTSARAAPVCGRPGARPLARVFSSMKARFAIAALVAFHLGTPATATARPSLDWPALGRNTQHTAVSAVPG